jgi:release factor glutamine methyltransferase
VFKKKKNRDIHEKQKQTISRLDVAWLFDLSVCSQVWNYTTMSNVTLFDIIHAASVQLASAGVDEPAANVRFLAGHALGLEPHEVKDHGKRVLSEKEEAAIVALIDRRAKRETINRITGKTKFCDLYFATNEATLEPRPDSEIIVRAIVQKIKRVPWLFRSRKAFRVLDLGTGSGCLLLSFLHALPNAMGLGVDLTPRALEQARENAKTLGLEARCEFRLNNWADGIEESFDIIAFNPPYIPTADIPTLMQAVRDFDPVNALDGGADGLDPYRIVIPQLPRLGIRQTEEIGKLLRQAGFSDIGLCTDAYGIDRVFVVRQT